MSEQELQSERYSEEEATPTRKRPRPGERRLQILQTLAAMLEQPGAERVTTASLALSAEVMGEVYDPARHELYREFKAVTYHDLRVEKTGGIWRARVIFDV